MPKPVIKAIVAFAACVFLQRFGERVFEKLPEHFPPKWMATNMRAIRDENARLLTQNERILQLLEDE